MARFPWISPMPQAPVPYTMPFSHAPSRQSRKPRNSSTVRSRVSFLLSAAVRMKLNSLLVTSVQRAGPLALAVGFSFVTIPSNQIGSFKVWGRKMRGWGPFIAWTLCLTGVFADEQTDALSRALIEVRSSFQQGLAQCVDNAARIPASFKPFQSPRVNYGDAPLPVSVDVAGLEHLCLTVKGTMGGGHTYWGEPVLIDAAGKATRLTDLQPQVVVLGWSELRVNKGGGPFYSIAKQRMAFGLFAHVDSYVSYPLGQKYVRFEAKAGISDTGSQGAHAVFGVAGGFDKRQVQSILRGSMENESVGDLGRTWQVANEGGALELVPWIRTPGAGHIDTAVRTLLAQCGDEPELARRLAAISASKKEGGEPEWLTLYFDVLATKRRYAALDEAAAQLDVLCAFMAVEGVPVDAFRAEIDAAKQGVAAERRKGAQALQAYCETLAALRRKILFTHPAADFKDLLIDVRHLPLYYHNVDQYLGRNSRVAPGLMVLEDWKGAVPKERWLTRDKLPPGGTQHPDLSYDGKKVLFGFCDHTEKEPQKRRFMICEAAVDGSGIRQVTGTAADPWEQTRRGGAYTVIIEDFDPHYLPDGGFVFTSTRSQDFGRCHAGRYAPAFLIHRGELDGTRIRALSWGEANELDPAVLNDGRIIYNRWEYVNRHDCLFHKLWTTRPDGTGAASFYGNLTPVPQSLSEARAIPGSGKVMATASGHHSFTAGSIVLLDPLKGVDGPDPVYRLTPEAKYPESQGFDTTTYVSPYPLTERLFFAAWSPYPHVSQGDSPGSEAGAEKRGQRWDAYAIYLVYHHGGKAYRELVYRPKEKVSAFTPIPIRPRPVPPVLPSSLPEQPKAATGTFYVQNVYQSLHPIEPNSVKYLRINALFNQPTPRVPHRAWVMDEVAKGVIGTVPVKPDGSVSFSMPSRTPVQLQLLDADKMCVMNMRSFIYLQDGEHASCVGCHEERGKSPPVAYAPVAPQVPVPVPGPDAARGFNYVATVQPVWDRYCIRCHGLDKTEGGVNLTGRYLERETERYPSGKLRMGASYDTLVRNPKYYKMMDRNCETVTSKPKDYLSHASGLPSWIRKHGKEKGAELDPASWERVVTWLDVNAQLYGNYSFNRPENREPCPEGEKALRAYVKEQFGETLATQPFEALVNNGCLDESRILNAPLAAEAGGWGQIAKWKSRDEESFGKMRVLVASSLKPQACSDRDFTCGSPERCRCGACWVRSCEADYRQKHRQEQTARTD